jgi:hypothetical protein
VHSARPQAAWLPKGQTEPERVWPLPRARSLLVDNCGAKRYAVITASACPMRARRAHLRRLGLCPDRAGSESLVAASVRARHVEWRKQIAGSVFVRNFCAPCAHCWVVGRIGNSSYVRTVFLRPSWTGRSTVACTFGRRSASAQRSLVPDRKP